MGKKGRRNKYMKGGDFKNPRRRDWHAGSDEPWEIAYRKKRSRSKGGWFSESGRHSTAAKKGWLRRKLGRTKRRCSRCKKTSCKGCKSCKC